MTGSEHAHKMPITPSLMQALRSACAVYTKRMEVEKKQEKRGICKRIIIQPRRIKICKRIGIKKEATFRSAKMQHKKTTRCHQK